MVPAPLQGEARAQRGAAAHAGPQGAAATMDRADPTLNTNVNVVGDGDGHSAPSGSAAIARIIPQSVPSSCPPRAPTAASSRHARTSR